MAKWAVWLEISLCQNNVSLSIDNIVCRDTTKVTHKNPPLITAQVCQPPYMCTIMCNLTPFLYYAMCDTVRGKSPQEGASTSINCAVNPELKSQQAHHYADCRETSPSSTSRYYTSVTQMVDIATVSDYYVSMHSYWLKYETEPPKMLYYI